MRLLIHFIVFFILLGNVKFSLADGLITDPENHKYCEGELGIKIGVEFPSESVEYKLQIDVSGTWEDLESITTSSPQDTIWYTNYYTNGLYRFHAITYGTTWTSDSIEVIEDLTPTAFELIIVGGGEYCNYGLPEIFLIRLLDSETGVIYTLTLPDGTTFTKNGTDNYLNLGYFDQVGEYSMIAEGTDSDCSIDMLNTVNIIAHDLPSPNFTFEPDEACSSEPVVFINLTIGGVEPYEYLWEFDDPSSPDPVSSLQNPSHTFWDFGAGNSTHNVNLLTTDSNGCVAEFTDTVTVIERPNARLDDPNNFPQFKYCENEENFTLTVINISNTKETNIAYSIDWGDGSNISYYDELFETDVHTYSGMGSWDLTFTALGINECSDQYIYSVYNGTNPEYGISNGIISGCAPFDIHIEIDQGALNNTIGTIYYFDWGDNSEPLMITQQEFISNYSDGLVTHSYTTGSCSINEENYYTVYTYCENPCEKIEYTVEPIQISTPAASDFNRGQFPVDPIYACEDVEFQFINNSYEGCIVVNGQIFNDIEYYWDFGDGTTSTEEDPTHIFPEQGIYTISLVATSETSSGYGCGGNTMTRQICVQGPPLADFTLNEDQNCSPFNLTPNNITLISPDECGYLNYYWSVSPNSGYQFTGGTDQWDEEPNFIFLEGGQYEISLYASNNCGSSWSDTIQITVNEAPSIEIEESNFIVCGSAEITFSPEYIGNINTYFWQISGGSYTFSPPSTVDSAFPTIQFEEPGTFHAIIQASNGCGINEEIITISVQPEIYNNTLSGNNILCEGEGPGQISGTPPTGGDEVNYAYQWLESNNCIDFTFIAGATSIHYTPDNFTGSKCYKRIVFSGECSHVSEPFEMTVYESPTANAGPDQWINQGIPAQLDGSLSYGGSGELDYLWTPESKISSGQNSESCYTVPMYDLINSFSLTVIDSNLCWGNDEVFIHTYPNSELNVIATLEPDTICLGSSCQLNSITGGGSGTYEYYWQPSIGLDNPNISNPVATPTTTTTYTIDVIDGINTISDEVTVVVNIIPNIEFIEDIEICSEEELFVNPVINGTNATLIWTSVNNNPEFLSGNGSSGEGPINDIIVNTSNDEVGSITYNLIPIGISPSYCPGSVTLFTVFVYPNPIAYAGEDQIIESGTYTTLAGSVSGGSGLYEYDWSPIAQIAGSADIENPQTIVLTSPPSYYSFEFMAIDQESGCTDFDEVDIYVDNADLSVTISPIEPYYCQGQTESIQLNAVVTGGTGNYSYDWSWECIFNEFLSVENVDSANPIIHFDPLFFDYLIVELFVFDGNDIAFTEVFTYFEQEPEIINTSPLFICSGESVNYQPFTYNPGITFEWVAMNFSPNCISGITDDGTVNITDILTNDCADSEGLVSYIITPIGPSPNYCEGQSIWLDVFVSPKIIANAGPDQFINEGTPAFLDGSGSYGGGEELDFEWSPENYIASGQGTTNPISYPLYPPDTNFTLNITDDDGCSENDEINIYFNSNSHLQVEVWASNNNLCFGESCQLFSEVTGGSQNYDYQWTPTAGISNPNVSNPFTSPNQTTNYTLYIDDGYNVKEANITINVDSVPYIINDSPINLCSGESLNFTPESNVPNVTFEYEIINNDPGILTIYENGVGSADDVIINSSNDSLGTISYKITSIGPPPTSCMANPIEIVTTVNPIPIANAGQDQYVLQGTSTVLDGSGSLGGLGNLSYLWDPKELLLTGDSNSAQPTTIPMSIDKTFTLTVEDDVTGCHDEDEVFISVVYPLELTLNASETEICSGQSSQLNLDIESGSGNYEYTWYPDDGSLDFINIKNPLANPFTTTTYSVMVFDNVNEISAWAEITIVVNGNIDVQFEYAGTCVNNPTEFVDLTIPHNYPTETWNWDFGDGTGSTDPDPTHSFSPHGYYEVSLTITDEFGCQSSSLQPIYIAEQPEANFTATEVCFGIGTQFTNLSEENGGILESWSWNFGDDSYSSDENLVHLFETPGTHNVSLEVTTVGQCISTIQQEVLVYELPTVDFEFENTCFEDLTSFTDLSQGVDSPIVEWLWDFDDGNPGDESDPVHSYQFPGQYDVTLIVFDENLCENEVTKTLAIHELPEADFTFQGVCENNPVSFTDQSTGYESEINSWYWSFGDNEFSSTQSPEHSYIEIGDYIINLLVIDENQCQDEFWELITIQPLPVADFSHTTACVDGLIEFTDNSIGNGTELESWYWMFEQGYTSTQQFPDHTFDEPGFYSVLLEVTSEFNCVDEVQKEIEVHDPPNVDFTFTYACIGEPTEFTDASEGNGGVLDSWYWEFGNGNTSTLTNPEFIFDSPGLHTVKLTVTNEFGCMDYIQKNITVYGLPVVAFDFDGICEASVTSFTDLSSGNGADLDNWLWSFGDSNYSDEENPEHTYQEGGTYTVNLLIENDNGCTNSLESELTILDLPDVDFTYLQACVGEDTYFYDNSESNGGEITSWLWDFGDGNYSTLENPKNDYEFAGPKTVQLTIETENSCINFIDKNIEVYDLPTPDFIYINTCFGEETQFTDLSEGNGSPVNSWYWEFGDEFSSIEPNPSHTFSQAGLYEITLVVTNENGCSNDTVIEITILELPVADFIYSGICLNSATLFTDQSTGVDADIETWYWDFGDGQNSTEANPEHTFTSSGQFIVNLLVEDENGCQKEHNETITIHELPTAYFTYENQCLGEITQFTDESDGNGSEIVTWQWDFGDNNTSTLQHPQNTFFVPGLYPVELEVQTEYGCYDINSIPVVISKAPVVNYSFQNTCIGDTTVYKDLSYNISGEITNWLWDFGDGNSQEYNNYQDTLHHQYVSIDTYETSLTVTGDDGCEKKLEQDVEIHELPDVQFDELPQIPINSSPYELTEGDPDGGWYTGPGITENYFYPDVAGLGEHVLSYTFADLYFCENSADQTIEVTLDVATSESSELGSDLIFYPNPSKQILSIYKSENLEIKKIKVVDNWGKQVLIREKCETLEKLNISMLPRGFYTFQVLTNKGMIIKKIIKN